MNLLAHGVGVRGDLPLPFWQFAWGAGIAVVITFVGLGVRWSRSRLPAAAGGKDLGAKFARVVDFVAVPARLASLGLFVLALISSLSNASVGGQSFGPITVYVSFWVGMSVVSALFGDLWRVLSPFETLAGAGQWVAARWRRGNRLTSDTHRREIPGGYWPAVVTLAGFLFLELGYHNGATTQTIGWAMVIYTVAMLGGAAAFGRQWLRQADGFGVLFSLLAKISPLYRDYTGAVRLRAPLAGLTTITPRTDLLAVLLLVLGGTSFDGFSAGTVWPDLVGRPQDWGATLVNTAGLAMTVAVVAYLYYLGSQAVGRSTQQTPVEVGRRFAHSLVPIVLGYTVAHYFSLVVFEGQRFLQLLSDPLAQNANWFGTADWNVNFLLVSTGTIAWVQFFAIVIGHILAVLVAHDRALETTSAPEAARSQLPMLAVMIIYSIAGLWLLQNA